MASTIAKVNPLDDVQGIANLLGLFKGSSKTTSSNISTEGVQALLNQMIQGSSGLGAIASGTKAAGGYGSTAQSLLTNDLLSTAAAKTAAMKAGTVEKNNAKFEGADILKLLALTGGKSLLTPTIKGVAAKAGIPSMEEAGKKLAELLLGAGKPLDAAQTAIANTALPTSSILPAATIGTDPYGLADAFSAASDAADAVDAAELAADSASSSMPYATMFRIFDQIATGGDITNSAAGLVLDLGSEFEDLFSEIF